MVPIVLKMQTRRMEENVTKYTNNSSLQTIGLLEIITSHLKILHNR